MKLSDAANEAELHLLNTTIPPMDPAIARQLLSETKGIMDRLGVVFFLRQGTVLGAVRDHAFIPWDDDIDIGVVIGLNGFTEHSIDRVVKAFRDADYYAHVERTESYVYSALMKHHTKIDLYFHRIVNGQIYHYPGLWPPVGLFVDPAEIEFLGETYRVPNPPEQYLRFKYGPHWQTPKRAGYEKDVLDNIGYAALPVRQNGLRRLLTRRFLPWRTARVRVLDRGGRPVQGANVSVVGLGQSTTDKNGYARLHPPNDNVYALRVASDESDEVLYEERLAPGGAYVYRPDETERAGRVFVLKRE